MRVSRFTAALRRHRYLYKRETRHDSSEETVARAYSPMVSVFEREVMTSERPSVLSMESRRGEQCVSRVALHSLGTLVTLCVLTVTIIAVSHCRRHKATA